MSPNPASYVRLHSWSDAAVRAMYLPTYIHVTYSSFVPGDVPDAFTQPHCSMTHILFSNIIHE